MSKKDEYVARMKQQLDDWSAEIDDLEAKAHAAKDQVKEKYQEQLGLLRAKREEGEIKLQEMRAATDSSWEKAKGEAENVWDALKAGLDAFKAHFK